MRLPEIQSRLANEGLRFVPMSADEFGGFVKAEVARWAPVVRALGAKPTSGALAFGARMPRPPRHSQADEATRRPLRTGEPARAGACPDLGGVPRATGQADRGSSPPGPTHTIARLTRGAAGAHWKQPVVVDYKRRAPVVGTQFVASSPADGYTLGMAISAHMINRLQPKLPYDTLKDLAGVSQVALSHFGLFAHPRRRPRTPSR